MRYKLDENLGTRTQDLFWARGHDVQTVRSEELQGCTDARLYEVCRQEQRCLVTLDLDFADVTRFPPSDANGIVVIRVPQNPSLPLLEQLIRQFLEFSMSTLVDRRLWIVEMGRVRIHEDGIDADTMNAGPL